MIARTGHVRRILGLLARFPVVGLVGARQVGKSTLARQVRTRRRGPATFFDLKIPEQRARLADPWLALSPLRGLVVIDEVRHLPELFSVLRPLADRSGKPARFLILGSASPELLRQSSESLAGRIAYYELEGLDLGETGTRKMPRLWLRGGFPLSYLAAGDGDSAAWRRELVRTFLGVKRRRALRRSTFFGGYKNARELFEQRLKP